MQKKLKKLLIISFLLAIFASAAVFVAIARPAAAATKTTAPKKPFYYGVWLPYWTSQDGAANVSVNLDKLNEVSPFSYELGNGGTLIDDLNIGSGSWAPWFSAVSELNIKIIPTIADFNGTAIYNLLSNTTSRQALETRIATLVKAQGFSGIDIDFESMTEDTRPYYSLFIEGLAERLHPAGKVLTCSVIARTPPQDLYTVITPDDTVYPENYSVLNQYCDEVRIEAYDEDTEDLTLDAQKGTGQLYSPVTDPAWVKQILSVTLPYINPKKVMLGIPTYGYEYEVSWNQGITTYNRVRAFDYLDAMDRADSLGITPTRNSADELSFTYTSSTYIQVSPILSTDVDSATEPPIIASTQLFADATSTGAAPTPLTMFYVTFPDAQSISDEIDIAKADGLRGVMLFKADGDIDPLTWQYMD